MSFSFLFFKLPGWEATWKHFVRLFMSTASSPRVMKFTHTYRQFCPWGCLCTWTFWWMNWYRSPIGIGTGISNAHTHAHSSANSTSPKCHDHRSVFQQPLLVSLCLSFCCYLHMNAVVCSLLSFFFSITDPFLSVIPLLNYNESDSCQVQSQNTEGGVFICVRACMCVCVSNQGL